jgi:hypothetical protein
LSAEPVGFEPTVGSTPTQLFESCTFGRSDTVPEESLIHSWLASGTGAPGLEIFGVRCGELLLGHI